MGRNSRRQQRLEKEEDLEEEEDTTTYPENNQSHQNTFSSFFHLTTEEEDQPEDEEEDNENDIQQSQNNTASSKKKRKPKKKPKSTTKVDLLDDATPTNTSINSKKTPQPQADEIDQALKELSEKLPNSITIDESSGPKRSKKDIIINNLLKIETKSLDPELELRRMFGAKVISSNSSNHAPMNQIYGAKISNNPHHPLNTKIKSRSTILTKPHPLWPELDKSNMGISVRKLSQDEIVSRNLADADQWYKFEHSLRFRFYQSRFFKAISESDPTRLARILRRSPYHPDTLLKLSEISAQNEDQSQSINFVNQALYFNEKILNFKSSSAVTSSNYNSESMVLGEFRLDYKSAENRNFFRALIFKLHYLIKQGCYKTAFETCKLLFSLNPYQDPYGSLLWIDFLAIKTDQHEFFLEFFEQLPSLQSRDPNGGIYVGAYPGLHFARAMSLRAIEDKNGASHEKSDSALESAIYKFPQVIKPLAEMIGITLPAKFEENKLLNLPFMSRADYPSTQVRYVDPHDLVNLTSQIYVNRSSSFWKLPHLSDWLQSTIIRSINASGSFKLAETRSGFHIISKPDLYYSSFESIYRSVMVSDVDALKRLLPAWVYGDLDSISVAFDPIPPSKGQHFNGDYFKDIGQEVMIAITPNGSATARRRDEDLSDSDFDGDELIGREDGFGNEGNQQQREEEEENQLIFSDDFDPTHLDQPIVDRLIFRIQATFQINSDQLSSNQRQDLLNRLEALFDRQTELRHQRGLDPPVHPSDPAEIPVIQVDAQEPPFDHSHQMPGSFFDPPAP